MKHLKSINLVKLKSAEIISFLKEFVQVVTSKSTAEKPLPTMKFAEPLQERIALMEQVYNLSRKSEKTALIHEQDSIRDSSLSAISEITKTIERHHFDPQMEEAASLWTDLIKHECKTSIAKLNLEEETTVIESIVKAVEDNATKYTDALELLGLNAFYTKMKEANGKLKELMAMRTGEASEAPQEKFATIRRSAEKDLRTLEAKVNAYTELEEEEDGIFHEMSIDLNAVIERYRMVIARKSKAENE